MNDTPAMTRTPGPRTYQSAWQWNPDGTAKLMTAEEWLEEEADIDAGLDAADAPGEGPSRAGILRAIAQEVATLRAERTQWAEAATKNAQAVPSDLPALTELARLATAVARTDPDDAPWWDYETLRKAFGAADDFERDECRFIAACSPDAILALVALATGGAADTARLQAKLARAEAESAARSLGWEYDDEHGGWYDSTTHYLQCLDEDLVAHFAAITPSATTDA